MCFFSKFIFSRSGTFAFMILLAVTVLISAVDARAAVIEYPAISARAAAVFDTSSGRFLYEKDADRQMKIASTTKIMTAIVTIENADLDDTVKISRKHFAIGSSMYLREGEEVSVRDLLYGLMLMSGNDAALALADHCAGGKEEFAALMNEKAREIGMQNSSFRNPNGLDEEGHCSTARDMALLAAYAMKNEVFRQIVGTKGGYFAGRYMRNHNKLLTRIEGATGLKTGYTDSAGRCLVSSVERGGREVIVVTLNAPDDWRDHTALYNKAFGEYKEYVAGNKGHVYAYIPVISGDVPMVGACLEEDVMVWAAGEENVEVVLYLPRFVYAPVCKDAIAGAMAVYINGVEVKRAVLRYDSGAEAVEQEPGFGERIVKFFKNLVR